MYIYMQNNVDIKIRMHYNNNKTVYSDIMGGSRNSFAVGIYFPKVFSPHRIYVYILKPETILQITRKSAASSDEFMIVCE
jgi:hypothetical protein